MAGLSLGGSKNKSKSSQEQSFNRTDDTRLSDRAYDALTGRISDIGGRTYQGLDPNAYKLHLDPFQGEVIDAVTADINANRDLAANQQRSDLAAAGAFGDDRRGIREAELTGQYDRTLASTLAGLRSGGFRQAQDVAQAENTNRNAYDANLQAQINQLLSLLGQETTTTSRGDSRGTAKGSGSQFGFGWGGK